MSSNKIALGTVQFGLNYGISNQNGMVALSEIEKILDFASSKEIDTLDTAQGYGYSEKALSHFDLSRFKIVTKIMGDSNLETSLENMNVQQVYALLCHREDEINDETWKKVCNYKSHKMTTKVGVSVYSTNKLLQIIRTYPIDIVQIPLNIFDQRFLPILPELKSKKIEVHVRSVFLQGLLLMESTGVSDYFATIKPLLRDIQKPVLATVVGFPKGIVEVDKLVIGCTCLRELQEIYAGYHAVLEKVDYSQYQIHDENIINPSHWPKHF